MVRKVSRKTYDGWSLRKKFDYGMHRGLLAPGLTFDKFVNMFRKRRKK